MTTGREDYPDYDALWHLVSMGVRTPDHKPNGWAYRRKDKRRTRVAIIDTSVAVKHPNLVPAINKDLALDLFTAPLGCFAYRAPDAKLGDLGLCTDTHVAEGLPGITEILTRLIDRTSHGSRAWPERLQPCVGEEFSNHGTAIAGLVGARPARVKAVRPVEDEGDAEIPLPYVGVDPHCEIVPISTNFDPDPEVLIVAFLYADLIDADVVLLPRNIPDPARTVPEIAGREIGGVSLAEATAPAATTPEEARLWAELAELIVNVSLKRPVVCAAGNAGEENGIYPANLASDHNGIISVGAMNAKGYLAGFSASQNITVMGPSGDAEVFDRTQVRLDTRRHDYDPIGVPEPNENHKYSHYDVISTDVPGIHGYSDSPYASREPEQGLREFGSYFCSFGGTSAASALVAGYLSLGFSAGALGARSDGLEAKSWLLRHCAMVADGDESYAYPAWGGTCSFPDR
ncbi:putative peptidase [Dinoroseobacter shibae DFL 12 = DSM 16493]|uniref:Putative peptidase n=1 Tax=Dinoroseobacter shibae (strain DSM 16493 / NCIMB 14021 / DFL 12) TaxID=398580 RepID=A8LRG3_DINSH|nr:S8/S53 family peptidase [Dinoroseobacter shibae]ABV92613.1 putative peptidase [Dinoroseobacter shibae DFL 12 = DSM 16493]URF47555.1 S8/S53 family peptidase [Dinoroseobacter shibae]URF51865.1 S8/S53 family peptidase [Dinoroseobacter shibae]